MAEIIKVTIQLRRATEDKWNEIGSSFIPKEGEPCLTLDGENAGKVKYGDGINTWSNLSYSSGAGIDDAVIAKDSTWSSAKIVDTVCPPFETSGPIVTCNPVEGYPLHVVSQIVPVQEGSGDPSPENVRPISGYDSVTVTQSKDGSQVKQITLALPETIYGGTVDAVTGEGEIQIAFMELDGTEEWVETGATSDTYQGFAMKSPYANANYSMFCSHFMYNSYENVANTCSQRTHASGYCIRFIISTEIVPNKTVAEWKSYLAAQTAAGTPVQVAYKLATPTSFQATGNQAFPALPGTNTIYTDTGDTTVSGRADPVATLQKLAERIDALQPMSTAVTQLSELDTAYREGVNSI